MFCSNCGKKLDEKAVVCPNCGVAVPGKGMDKNTLKKSDSVKGKSIASMVLGIIGILYALQAFAAFSSLDSYFYLKTTSYQFGFAIGFVLVQSVLAIVGICLAVTSKKIKKNGYNTAGFWLAIATFVIVAIQFIYVVAY